MQSIVSRKSIFHCAVALAALVLAVSTCQAQSSSPNLDKHARRIHKTLTHYSSGTYVDLVLRDGSQSAGSLGAVNAASFTITNADNNVPETHSYGDVYRVEKGREYIGAGSEGHHIHWVRWSAIGVAAAGAAVTAFAVR